MLRLNTALGAWPTAERLHAQETNEPPRRPTVQPWVASFSDQGYGRGVGTPTFHSRVKAKKGYHKAKKGYNSSTIPFFGFDPGVKIGGTPLPWP